MSSESVIVTPSNPSSDLRRSLITSRARVDGTSRRRSMPGLRSGRTSRDRARRRSRAERGEFDGVEPARSSRRSRAQVRVDRAPALAGKVLCRGRDAGGSQAAHSCRHHTRHGSASDPKPRIPSAGFRASRPRPPPARSRRSRPSRPARDRSPAPPFGQRTSPVAPSAIAPGNGVVPRRAPGTGRLPGRPRSGMAGPRARAPGARRKRPDLAPASGR